MLSAPRRLVLRAAAGPVARTVPWSTVAGVLALAWAPLVVALLRGGESLGAAVAFAGIVSGGVAALAVDDAAAELTGSVPVPLAQRRALRLAEVALAWGSLAGVLLVLGARRDGALVDDLADRVPEVLAAAALGLAVASSLADRGRATAGLVGAATGPLAVGLVGVLAHRVRWLPSLEQPQHHDRWWWVVLAAGGAAAWWWRDPAAGRPVRWRG